MAARHGITCLNTPGTIDSDYRGEIKVILVNHGAEPFTIQRGDRIAQLVVAPVSRATWSEVESLDGTVRGGGGSEQAASRHSPQSTVIDRPIVIFASQVIYNCCPGNR